jgi:hypothetical protein
MAGNEFKYIIKTDLQLNTGSINKLLNEVKEVDKQIKQHFDNAKTGGIKVPLSVDPNISKLQGDVKRVVDGYNKGQAPTIKLPISIDEGSIRKLQNRISELRKQINSLADDKKTISVNTSLKVGAGEKEGIQKQVGDTKATINVGLRLNDQDMKVIKAQIESIKAEVKASVVAQQDHRNGDRRLGVDRSVSPVNNARQQVSRNNSNRNTAQQAKRDYDEVRLYYRQKAENLKSQIKSEQELQHLRDELDRAKNPKKARKTDNMVAYGQDGSKKNVSVTDYTKQLEDELRKQEKLANQIKRANQASEIAKQKAGSFSTAQVNKSVTRLATQPTSQEKVINNISKAEAERKLKELDALQKEIDNAHRQANRYDRVWTAKRQQTSPWDGVSRAQMNTLQNQGLREQRKREYQIYQANKQRIQNPADAWDMAHDVNMNYGRVQDPKVAYRQAVQQNKIFNQQQAENQRKYQERMNRKSQREAEANTPPVDNRSLDEKYYDTKNVRVGLQSKLQQYRDSVSGKNITGNANKRRVLDNIAKMQKDIQKAIDEEQSFYDQIKALTNSTPKYRSSLQSNHVDPYQQAGEKLRNTSRQQWNDYVNAYEQRNGNPNYGRVEDVNEAHKQANDINRSRITESNRQQRANDFNQGILRYGANREYSGVDYDAMLRNPNVSLSESMRILRDHIHPTNQAMAREQQTNFQRAYTINYRDDEGHIRSVRTLTHEYTSLGEVVQRGDRSFKSMASNMMKNIGVYTLFTSGFYAMSQAIGTAVAQMVDFDAKLAQVSMVMTNMQTGGLSDQFSQFGAGINSAKSNITNQAFSIGENYGVSTADTVVPLQAQVLARKNLITSNGQISGKVDPNIEKNIVDKIIQFSAVSNGGDATSADVNAIAQDSLSLYQAMYTQGDTSHIGKMDNLFNYLAVMKGNGVNTNNVTDALSEIAPDTIKKGIKATDVAGMLGAYNLTDTDSSGAVMAQVGKAFFGALAHPDNPSVKSALDRMKINTDKYDTPEKLFEQIKKKYGGLNEADQEFVSNNLAGLTGKSSAMGPKMVKFLDASFNSEYTGEFNKQAEANPDALQKSWSSFSDTIKRNFGDLAEQVKELVQQLAKLGALDTIGLLIKGFTGLFKVVNSVLSVINKLSDAFSDNKILFGFNPVKMTSEIVGLTLAFKGLTGVINHLTPLGPAIGDYFERMTGRRLGFKQIEGATPLVRGGRAISVAEGLAPVPMISPRQNVVRTGEQALRDVMTYSASDVMTNRLLNGSAPRTTVPTGINMSEASRESLQAMRGELTNTIERTTARRSAIGAVGNFIGDTLLLTSRSRGAVGEVAGSVGSRAGGIMKGVVEWFVKLLPALRTFGLLLTRLTIIGTVLAGAWWVVSKAIEHSKKVAQDQYNTTNKSLISVSKKITGGDTATKDKTNKDIQDFIKANVKFMKETTVTSQGNYGYTTTESVPTSEYDMKAQARNAKIASDRKKMEDKYGISFGQDSKGNQFVKYHLLGADGKMDKKEYRADLNDKKDMAKFQKAVDNGFKDPILEAKDKWAVDTSYVMDYNKALIETNKLTKQISQAMKELGYNVDAIDMKFMGANSTESLNQKIQAIQQGMNAIKTQSAQIEEKKNQIDGNMNSLQGQLSKESSIALKHGVKQSKIDDVQYQYELAKQSGNLDQFLGNYSEPSTTDIAKWKKKGMSDKEINQKIDEAELLKNIAKLIMTMGGLGDAQDQLTDAYTQSRQDQLQNQEAMKQYTAQLIVASTGLAVMDAQISKINSAVGMGRAMVQMSQPNSKEQQTAQGGLIKASGQLLKGYQAELSSVSNEMATLARQNPNQDFSINELYNPGKNGLSSEQQAYKDLLEKQTSIQDSVSSTTADMYDQAQQLKDMVLNSDKYADVWERVQNRTQLVKDANKQISNSQDDLAVVNTLSQMRSAVTGTPYNATRNDKLAQIRDTNLDNYEKLTTALNSYKGDAQKLSQAYDDINKTMGSEFDKAFIDPLKNLIKNDFQKAGDTILNGANSLNTILGNWAKVQMSSASNPNSVAGQTQSFSNAMAIPTYTGSPSSVDNRTFAQKEQAYLEQMGYKVGTSGYAQMKRQLESSYTHEELVAEVDKNTVPTKNNSGVNDYTNTINGVLRGNLAGYGSVFVQAGAKYGVDPRLIASIAMQENGGNSNILNHSNNIGNIKATGSSNDYWKGGNYEGYRSYATLTDGIMDLTRLIGNYISSGKNTIPTINHTYAEDPNWEKGVASFYSKQTGISVSSLLGGTAVSSGGGSSSSSASSGFGKSSYTGDSIVAYLNSLGKSSSFSARTSLAHQYGISNYTGTASQNTSLLAKLRASSGGSSSSSGGGGSYSAMDSWFSSVKGDRSKLTYSWGGAHVIEDWTEFLKKGIADCSGLVEQVYRKFAGINLGTTSSKGLYAQNDGGKKVTNKKDLQPGDLVFFGKSADSIHHVGIYAGNDQMWTIDHNGTPVSKDNISSWGDYYGGKHYDGAFGGAGSLTQGQASASDILKSAINSFITAMQAEAETHSVAGLKETYNKDVAIAYGQGNITDVMGTSGRLAYYDRVNAERANVFEQRYDTVQQLNQLSTSRKNYVNEANKALKAGNTTDYNTYKDAVKSIDDLISTLKDTNKQLADYDKTLSDAQQKDPRYNYDTSMSYVKGGYDKLNAMDKAGQEWSPDYIKLLGEMSTMLTTYDTHAKNTQLAGDVWSNSGQQTTQFIMAKRVSDQDNINLMFDKITKINAVLKNFAQGTNAWYTTLEEAVKVQQELHDLEQQRLQNAQSMFELTGKGIQGYVKQKAYTQSKDYSQEKSNLTTAINQYKNGTITNGSGLRIALGSSDKYAKGLSDILHKQYDISSKVTKDKDGKYYLDSTKNLTKDQAQKVIDTLKKQGHIGNGWTTGGGSSKMDENQQLANLQIIAGLHDQMIQQMNDYRSAVVGAFKAGAMSLDEYMKKMNDLRDVQNETKENAVKMVDALSSGFQDAFANALSGGMQGNMDSTQSFIDSMKQTMAQTISGTMASSIFNNSGLLDVTNGLISQITQAATSGDPNAVANMFNNNDFSQQFQDALAPFLPLINQIVASTNGMFTIMKNQVFNAPNGFKIDSEVAQVAKAKGIGEVRQWDPTGKNGSGSDDGSGSTTTTPIVTPPSSSTPGGVPGGTSSGGATSNGGSPEGTGGTGTGAPSTSGSTTTPSTDTSKINTPAPPASSSKKGTYITTSDVWDHKTPDANKSSRIKVIKKGTKVNVIGEKSGFLEIGTNQWISAQYAKAYTSSGGSGSGSGSSGSTKHINTTVNFRSSAGYGNNVIGTIPKGSAVTYLGTSNGWAHVKYGSKSGYVGPQFVYHTGGLAGMMNFSSPNGLKPDELQAVLRQGEGVFTQKQISSLVGASNTTHNGGDVNFNITVNVEGGQDTGQLQATVETAVKKAMQVIKKDTKFQNLTFKGTSY